MRTPLPEPWLVDLVARLPPGSPTRMGPSTTNANRTCLARTVASLPRDNMSLDNDTEECPIAAGAGSPRPTDSRRTNGGHKREVFVTGSTGFVGSRLCEVLHASRGYEPRPFVHSSGTSSYIARYPLRLALGDLMDWSSIRRGMDGCSFVVHLARGSKQVMIEGLKNVLRAAVDAGVSRFVHVSSVAVYGSDPPPAARFEAARPRRTGEPYGDLKLEQEELVTSYCTRVGLPFVILRPPHISGPLSHFVRAVARGLAAGTLPIVEHGANVCNLVFIDNFIEAVLLSLEREGAAGETFFIVDKERVVWRKCLEDFADMLGVTVPRATPDQIAMPTSSGVRASFRAMARIARSHEFRSAVLGMPAVRTVASVVAERYAGLSPKQQSYIRRRLAPVSALPSRSSALPVYDATDYLIVSQRRNVVHAYEKAERLLGYTAPVGYAEALTMTRNWLQFAGVI